MLIYLFAAVALSLALVLFGMALRHKSLLDAAVEGEMLARLDRLTPSATRAWGRMEPAQMLHHVAGGLSMATGDLSIAPRNSPLRRFPIKQLIVFALPFPHGAPTAPILVAREEFDFDTQRAAVRERIASFAKREIAHWPDHPAFGPLNREQWGVMVWKHLDHHFRQFGV